MAGGTSEQHQHRALLSIRNLENSARDGQRLDLSILSGTLRGAAHAAPSTVQVSAWTLPALPRAGLCCKAPAAAQKTLSQERCSWDLSHSCAKGSELQK